MDFKDWTTIELIQQVNECPSMHAIVKDLHWSDNRFGGPYASVYFLIKSIEFRLGNQCETYTPNQLPPHEMKYIANLCDQYKLSYSKKRDATARLDYCDKEYDEGECNESECNEGECNESECNDVKHNEKNIIRMKPNVWYGVLGPLRD